MSYMNLNCVTYVPHMCHICITCTSHVHHMYITCTSHVSQVHHMCHSYITSITFLSHARNICVTCISSHLYHICVKRTSPMCQMYVPYVPRECHMCVTSTLYMCHIYITSITHTSRASRDPFQSANLNSKGKFHKHIYSCNFAIKASTLDTTRHFHPRVCTIQLFTVVIYGFSQ